MKTLVDPRMSVIAGCAAGAVLSAALAAPVHAQTAAAAAPADAEAEDEATRLALGSEAVVSPRGAANRQVRARFVRAHPLNSGAARLRGRGPLVPPR